MKKFYILSLLFVSTLVLVAQTNKKIALLEPRVGDGSSSVTGMEKAMIRGELRKAIVNHTGYEAFTRADIDQLMKEHDFQRTGNVSDSQIHKIGEMSGADYICISTLNKSNTEFYIEAYLVNVESGAISNPASQYGELSDGKLTNMLPVCQSLAQELLGTSTPIISTSGSTSQTIRQNVSANVEPSKKSSGRTDMCKVISFADGTKGVAFYMDEQGHGLAVSMRYGKAVWDNSKKKDMEDINNIPNVEDVPSFITKTGLGMECCTYIVEQLSLSRCPAVAWCLSLGDGWYLPSAEELSYLFRIANVVCNNTSINGVIAQNGGTPLVSGWYWSSSEKGKTSAINVYFGSASDDKNGIFWRALGMKPQNAWATGESKDKELYVRAIRQF